MRRSVLFIVAIWLCFGLTSYVKAQLPPAKSAQKQALPKFRTGTPYPKVRKMLMALGWQPVTLQTATPCGDDDRCRGFPEVYFCSGVGQAVCIYMWKKETTLIRVFGSGESVGQAYDGLKPCPLHPTQFDPECGGRAPDSATPVSASRRTQEALNIGILEDNASYYDAIDWCFFKSPASSSKANIFFINSDETPYRFWLNIDGTTTSLKLLSSTRSTLKRLTAGSSYTERYRSGDITADITYVVVKRYPEGAAFTATVVVTKGNRSKTVKTVCECG